MYIWIEHSPTGGTIISARINEVTIPKREGKHFEVARTEEIERCLGDACPGSGEGDDGSAGGVTPITTTEVYGHTVSVYSDRTFYCDDGDYEPIDIEQSDGTSVTGWYCETEEIREARLIANSCRDAYSAAWCTGSKTCTDEVQGEYATFTSFLFGGTTIRVTA